MKPIISICVPSYNRYYDLVVLIESIKLLLQIYWKYHYVMMVLQIKPKIILTKINEGINIKYKFIEHTGRPKALREYFNVFRTLYYYI